MHATATFTGRRRRRTSHPWVRFGDALARGLITLGGIGTILAVLGVGVFLFVVAAPLFRPARVASLGAGGVAAGESRAIGTDEAGAVAWLLGSDGLRGFNAADGQPLFEKPADAIGLADCSAIRVLSSGLLAAAGFTDGSFRTGMLGLESSFLDAADLPAGTPEPEEGAAVVLGDGVAAVRGAGGQLARVAVVADISTAAGEPLPARIIDIDVTPLAGGPLVAALDQDGRVRVESSTSKRNMLTGKRTTVAAGATIPPSAGFQPRFVRVSELGDQLFLIGADGAGKRYLIRDVTAPAFMEAFQAGGPVTAVERLFGGTALAVGFADGTVRVLFTARTTPAAGETVVEDGLTTETAREFPGGRGAAPITALATSPRSRLFAAADEAGRIRLLHSTAGREVAQVRLPEAAAGAVAALAIPPRENRLLAAGGLGFGSWSIDAGFPEISSETLLRPVWYEGYAGPVHAWETTGHEAFESKFGLVPLIFGTVKATVYSMLFATPIALLAAIYASQFMQPKWKARIKPTIEMMASLPSVVLGFIAGLVFAPLIEQALMPVLTGFVTVPLALLVGAHLWQLLPSGIRSGFAGWRFLLVALAALPAGVGAAVALAPAAERLLFQGDVRSWLDGRDGSGFGGWVVAMLPPAAVAMTWFVGRVVNPWLRQAGAAWSPRRAGLVSLLVFAAGVAGVLMLAVGAAAFFDAVRLDTRGGLFGTYVQRNAMVVAVGMSFAIIPL
ncbi:MAG: hypothetical protein ACKO1M_02885, partial [Planctomycetota bacterium]